MCLFEPGKTIETVQIGVYKLENIEKCDNLKWIRNTALYIYALYKRSDFLATTDVQKMLWKILKSCWITWINYSDSIGLLCVVIFSHKCLTATVVLKG